MQLKQKQELRYAKSNDRKDFEIFTSPSLQHDPKNWIWSSSKIEGVAGEISNILKKNENNKGSNYNEKEKKKEE